MRAFFAFKKRLPKKAMEAMKTAKATKATKVMKHEGDGSPTASQAVF